MHQAELLNAGQYASRLYWNASDPVFIEEMQLEISRATQNPLVLTDYDAAACYDCFIPNLGMTVSRKNMEFQPPSRFQMQQLYNIMQSSMFGQK